MTETNAVPARPPVDLNELRSRILAGQPYNRQELAAALVVLRENRLTAATKSVSTRKAKAEKAKPMTDDALDDSLRQLGLNI